MSDQEKFDQNNEIAIIGMAGRFPGARNIEEFWRNLCNGVESISFFSDQELELPTAHRSLVNDASYVKAGAVLEGIEYFDAPFFGYNPREAEIMDPQQRFFLECAWEALENAGYNPEQHDDIIGVYAGASMSDYLLFNLLSNRALIEKVAGIQIMIGNDKDHLPMHVSYKLNLTGPSITVNTACSTSLVAVHLACQSLLNEECDIALAGGVSIGVRQKAGYVYQPGGIRSPDGHCRAFDEKAQGTINGNGIGIVVLKRLENALIDRDTIHAVIKGSAINNDGSLKAGYTAPSVEGQARVIVEAQTLAGIDAETIAYIETHGTGTPLGDLVEITALTRAFRVNTDKKGMCAIGSVKTNIGHLDAAAGVAGLIKAVLSLKYRMIPPSLHYKKPNPQIDFANSPFYVNAELCEWETSNVPRRAGVSSFGIGGTNAHVVLEEAPPVEQVMISSRPSHLLVLSAKSASALEEGTANLLDYLLQRTDTDLNFASVAFTYQVGRKVFNYRRIAVCRDRADAIAVLQTLDTKRVVTAFQESLDRSIVFMFPGGGAQHTDMGRELYLIEPVFREHVDLCSELLLPRLGINLRDILYPPEGQTGTAVQELRKPAIGLCALFVINHAMALLWISWGIYPQAMIGHSLGEYVAACLAGVMSLEDALALVALRGRLFEKLPAGAMLSVPLSEEQIYPLLGENLSIASINGPAACVVSGSVDAIEALEKSLHEKGIKTQHLFIDVAAHSPIVEPILEEFADVIKGLSLRSPRIPYISNVTGTWITAEQAIDPYYWVKHLRQTVHLAEGIFELLQDQERVFLEVGPGSSLSSMVKLLGERTPVTIQSLPHVHDPRTESAFILHSLGQLWLSGVKIEWSKLHAREQCQRIPLPTYPFERRRYWIEAQESPTTRTDTQMPFRLRRSEDLTDWFYIPSWKTSMLPDNSNLKNLHAARRDWLIFDDGNSLSRRLIERLRGAGQNAVTVTMGTHFRKKGDAAYSVNPTQSEDYVTLLKALKSIPTTVIHFWSLSENDSFASEKHFFQDCQRRCYYSLLFLAHALSAENAQDNTRIVVVSDKLYDVSGNEVACPEKVTLLGPCMVIPQEHSHVTCLSVDIVRPAPETASEEKLIDQLLAEIEGRSLDLAIAYRGNRRLVRTYEAIRLEGTTEAVRPLRQRGIYLIAGGLGKIGLLLAEYLARTVQARLILLGRTKIPERSEWNQWLDLHNDDAISQTIRKLMAIEAVGSEVMTVCADVALEEQMRFAVQQAEQRYSKIDGIFYAAGATGVEGAARPIAQIGYEESELQFQSKAYGLYVLEKILEGKSLDFCLLFSSNASILGGLGFAAYAAANLFIDAFVASRNKSGHLNWICSNWDGWQDEEEASQRATLMHSSMDEYAMAPRESLEALKRIVSLATVDQIIVSSGDLLARYSLWIQKRQRRGQDEEEEPGKETSFYPRPDLKTGFVAPRNECERIIAEIWSKFLGVEQVGVYDNFFELGGHSLLAIQIIAQMCDRLYIKITINDMLEFPTIEELASLIEKKEILHSFNDGDPSALVALQPVGSKRPFFCVHPQGGGVSCYLPLSRYLGADQPFYGLEEPALDGKQEPFTSIENMAAYYIEALRKVQPQGPFFLGGVVARRHRSRRDVLSTPKARTNDRTAGLAG
ncbi:MAG: beta-ketoacyl synthase N-terminal-like domain-containing protein [Ktedonobacteraceae bacterium]